VYQVKSFAIFSNRLNF